MSTNLRDPRYLGTLSESEQFKLLISGQVSVNDVRRALKRRPPTVAAKDKLAIDDGEAQDAQGA